MKRYIMVKSSSRSTQSVKGTRLYLISIWSSPFCEWHKSHNIPVIGALSESHVYNNHETYLDKIATREGYL